MADPVTPETMKRFIDLSRKIQVKEESVSLKTYESLKKQCDDLQETIRQLQKHHQTCVQQTKKEKDDVDKLKMPNVLSFFQNPEAYNKQLTKEQEEYLDALNKEEVAKKQLEGVQEQHQQLKKETERTKSELDELIKIYKEHDDLLDGIFDGSYGSEKENLLERQVDQISERKQKIELAYHKWTSVQTLLKPALQQLQTAVQMWDQVKQLPESSGQERYDRATKARDNLIAAAENLTNANNYLTGIKLPYCAPPEIETLKTAVTHVYTDMRTPDRHAHARQCYDVTCKRCAALVQWVDNVVQQTIVRDLDSARTQLTKGENDLRAERVRLIREKAGGAELGAVPDQLPPAPTHKNSQVYVTKGSEEEAATKAPKVSTHQLPPPPSKDEIFGQLDNLKKQHEHEMEEYERAQELSKTRMQQDLEDKLNARRNRKERNRENTLLVS